jgi:FkbM family methyltransferase
MRKLVRSLLNYLGYDIVRAVPTPFPFFKQEYNITVGKFNLLLPIQNPLIKTYQKQVDFGNELGRLITYVYSKYSDLIFLDIGANAGDTVAIVKSFKDVPIIAVEGDAFSFNYLKKNTEQFRNVTIHNDYLGEKEGRLNVDLQKKGWNTTIIPDNNSNATIEITTLDQLLEDYEDSITKIKMVKIDTEGFDTIIIRGAKNFISKIEPVIYFEYNRENMSAINEDGLSTLLELDSWGYKYILLYDDKGRYILSTDFINKDVIRQLHNYADGKYGRIYYYNICVFAESDSDLALKTIAAENALLG